MNIIIHLLITSSATLSNILLSTNSANCCFESKKECIRPFVEALLPNRNGLRINLEQQVEQQSWVELETANGHV